MKYKKCSKCNKVKLTKNFYFRNDSQKYRNYCIKCSNKKCKKYYNFKKEKIKKQIAEYRKKNKKIIFCHNKALWALKTGRLTKGVCVICKNKRVEAHHENYKNPLDVVWLCRKHHKMLHIWRDKL